MAAGPQNGTIRFVSVRTGATYNVSIYCSDVTANMVTFSLTGKAVATDPNYYKPPEAVYLQDIILAADLTDCDTLQLLANGQPTGIAELTSVHLASITYRPQLAVMYGPAKWLQIMQRA